MKTLEINFVANNDKSGLNRFIQNRLDGNVALYRRENMEGRLIGFEVFVFKTIKEGSPLPGGGTVQETYQSYPGKSAFGRSAWFIGGVNAEKRANQKFDILTKAAAPIVENEEEETVSVPVVRVSVSNTETKFNPPGEGWKGTQKELAALLGMTNYKEAYSPLQKWLKSGVLRQCEERKSNNGAKRTAMVFERV